MKFSPFHIIVIACMVLATKDIYAQDFNPGNIPAESWQQVSQQKKGTVSVIWYDIDPFIYTAKDGKIQGVEYEIMMGFSDYLHRKYNISLSINWVNAGTFENIYPFIKRAKQPGLFGWSFYSITDDRKKEVQFSPPYMPDLNIVATNNSMPYYTTNQEFIGNIKNMQAYTMASTTMEDDVKKLKNNFFPGLAVTYKMDDYRVLEEIANTTNAFGYVPLSIYITALQKGIKIKRQEVLMTRREGFAGIMPLNSDWVIPISEYFNTPDFKIFVNATIKKYLGSEVSDLIFNVSVPDSLRNDKNDIELLTLEKEIVTQRLVESALEIQQERNLRSVLIIAASLIIIFVIIIFRRIQEKQKINQLLQERSETILQQKAVIEDINRMLELKVLQSQLNPHFIFNSLNAVQYFVGVNDKKGALSYISGFSRFLRQLLKNAGAITNSVTNESVALNQYLQLEKLRFNNRFDFTVTVQEHAELFTAEIPSLLVHSFAENALYHGILNRPNSGGFIDISFNLISNAIQIVIEDNGIGRTAATEIKNRKGIDDLTPQSDLIKQRIALLNVAVEKKIEIFTQDILENETAAGTKVIIKIPLGFMRVLQAG